MVSSLGGAGALAAPPFAAAQGASDAHGIRFDDVSVAYGEQVVLESLTLAVKPGEIVALIGPSGSGKTTALRAVAGFVRPARARRRRRLDPRARARVVEDGGNGAVRAPVPARAVGRPAAARGDRARAGDPPAGPAAR